MAIVPAGVRSNKNRLLSFEILMVLGDNYGVTIFIKSGKTTAKPFSNKILVEILDSNFSDGFCRQASNHYASK